METNDLRKAAQAVVDRWDTPLWKDAPATATYIEALRQALAESANSTTSVVEPKASSQTEQEPVAWMSDHDVDFEKSSFGTYPCVPLYTAPPKPAWVELTDDETNQLVCEWFGEEYNRLEDFICAIEAKLKEKNR